MPGLLLHKLITTSVNALDRVRAAAQLFAQVGDMRVHTTLGNFRVVAPDFVNQIVAAIEVVRVPHEEGDQLEFDRRHVDGALVGTFADPDGVRVERQPEVAHLDVFGLFRALLHGLEPRLDAGG